MAIGTLTFHNIKTIQVTPEHFEHTDPRSNIKSWELVLTDENDVTHVISIYGNLRGANNLPEMIQKPTKIIKLP